MKLKYILNEITSNTFQMYHGGQKWFSEPEIRPNKGRYEAGPGIYFTNNYETAKKYAKGSNVVQIVDIKKNYTDLKNIRVEKDEIIEFLNDNKFKNRKNIIADINTNAARTGNSNIPLTVLNNLIVNWEAGSGEYGKSVAKFFVDNGADAVYDSQSGNEFWLIVFNPKIILDYKVTKPTDIDINQYMLPNIK